MKWFLALGKVQVDPNQEESREGQQDDGGSIRMPIFDAG
jgi:hypothetical protein